jgi:HEAT repeat protein
MPPSFESAVEALGKIGGTAATTAMRGATQHSSLRVRVKAREVLRQIESKDLEQALADKEVIE